MGDIINLDPTQKGFRTNKKPSKQDQIDEMALQIKVLGEAIGDITKEIFTINARNIALYKALENKGVISDDAMEESWNEHVLKPYEDSQNAPPEDI